MYRRSRLLQDMPALLPSWWPLGETGGDTGLIVSWVGGALHVTGWSLPLGSLAAWLLLHP